VNSQSTDNPFLGWQPVQYPRDSIGCVVHMPIRNIHTCHTVETQHMAVLATEGSLQMGMWLHQGK